MNAAEARGRRSAFMRELARAETADTAQDVIRAAVGMGASSLDLAEMWAAVKARRLMTKAVFDGTVAEARGEVVEREGGELVPFPGAARGCLLPEGAAEVPGSPGFAWRPPSPGDPGEVYQHRSNGWRSILPWAPAVPAVFETPNDQGEITARYFEIEARGRTVRSSADELAKGEPWLILSVPGTGSKRVREVLVNVVLAAADTATPRPALTRTGWHEGEDGAPFYVFADGRAYPPRDVCLIGAPEKLPAAAAPVAPVELADVAEALVKIATFGGGPALAALGMGVRSLGHSRHKVLGGSVLRGNPNSGKTGAAWHARTLTIARPGRANAFPPLVSATFADTLASIEGVVNFEGDMPSVIDDAALHSKSTRASEAEAAAKIEHVFRPLFNDSQIKGRSTITTLPRAGRYVRSPVIATVQKLPESSQGSIKRRVAIWPVEPGDIDVRWYRGPAEAPGTNAASLVAPLRTLGEHLVIPALAARGADMGAYLMGKDAAALALLSPALGRELPGWQDSAEGLAGVVEIAAAALAGLLIAAEVVRGEVPADLLTDLAVSYLVGALVAQAAEMSDGASATSPVEAVGEIIRAAWLDLRGHVCDAHGAPSPVVPGLSPQEQGLARAPGGVAEWAGRGVPFYWLPDHGAIGVTSASLHKLLSATADPRVPAGSARALPRTLGALGAALSSGQETGAWTHQKDVGGDNKRLIYLRPEVVCGNSDASSGPGEPLGPLGPLGPRSDGGNRTQVTGPPSPVESVQAGANGTPVTGEIGDVLDSAAGLRPSGSSGSVPLGTARTGATPAIVQAEGAAEGATMPAIRGAIPPGPSPRCAVCNGLLDRALAALGETTHPLCAPGELLDGAQGDALGGPADAAPAPRPPSVEAPAQARTRAAVRVLCLGAEGRAYGPGGEVVEVPPGALDGCRNVGDVAALALALGTRELWVTREAREALGLPASLPDEDRAAREGVPHIFTEGADPAAWDVRPDRPVGLAAWMTVYRVPRSGEGVALVFPEWLDRVGDAPAFGELAPVELARALTLIWQASTYDGNGGKYGGAHYHRSPPAWFRRVMETSVRRSRSGTPGAADLPPIFAAPDKRAPVWIPGAHSAPAEIPPGWVVAKLDVRSCYPSAATGTDFGRGACERIPGGRLDKTPGVHLVRLPADRLAPHASLSPWAPAPRGRREVSVWLDTVAALWLHEARVPFRLAESYVWPEATGRRVFDAPLSRLAEARAQLDGAEGAAAQLAAAVVKAGPNAFLGGWLASDFGGERAGADWTANRAWWLTVKTQAEVRKQRNLLPMIGAGVVILGSERIDTVYCAAPSVEALTSAPGTGRRPAVGPARGKFKVEAVATVGEALAAQLADVKAGPHARLAALAEVLDAPGADGK